MDGNTCVPRTFADIIDCLYYGLNKCIVCAATKMPAPANGASCVVISPIANCVVATPDVKTCLRCAEGFVWNGAACAATITDCKYYKSATSCFCCTTGKTLVNNQCVTP